MLWNVRSLVNNLKFHFITQTLKDNDIHIAFITESWLSPDQGHNHTISEIKKLGWNISFTARKLRTGGGVVVLLKDFLKFKPITKCFYFSSLEWNGIRVFGQKITYCMLCIYRKQEISMLVFIQDLKTLLNAVCADTADEVVVLGDFNVHYGTNDKSSQDVCDVLYEFGLSQQVRGATRISGYTLDLIFTNSSSLDINATVDPDLITTYNDNVKFDHYPICFDLLYTTDTLSNFSNPKIIKMRNLKGIHLEDFEQSLISRLNSFETQPTFYEQLSLYNQSLTSTLNDFAPVHPKLVLPKTTSLPEWMDDEYKQQRRLRRKLERDKKNYSTEASKTRYNQQRDLCVVMANNKQKEFYSNLLQSTDNQHDLFKNVSSLWNKPKVKYLPSHDDPLQLANEINSFFIDKINKIRQQFHQSFNTTDNNSNDNHIQNSLSCFTPVSMDSLKEIIKDMTIKTSFDDPLPASLLKSSLDLLLPYILELVNLSLETGDITGLKESVITPILKKINLDSEVFAHFRPIVNLQFLSKLIEKCVLVQLTDHMKANGLDCSEQFAYKKNHSTETMVLQIVNDVLVGFDKHSCTILVMLDMSAAFDTVDIQKLLNILEHKIGLAGTVLEWFRSFLLDRKQKVLISGQLSEAILTLYGVPQGSVLGPVLFNIYVSSLPSIIKGLGFKTSIYADDSNARLQFSLKFQYYNIIVKLPELIEEITSWMHAHFLKINPGKTELILFCPPSAKNTATIQGVFLSDSCLRFSKSVRLLGVNLDTSLDFGSHVNNLVSECFYHLKNIAKIRRYLTDAEAQKLVHAFVTSKLDFTNSVLFGIKASSLSKLQRVQNYAARLASGFPSRLISTSSLLQNMHWLTIKQRILFKLLLLVHKFFVGLAPQYFCELLLVRCVNERLLHLKFMNTSSGKRSFEYAACRLWNRLPCDVRMLDDSEQFKSNIKTILFSNQNNILNSVTLYN